MRTNTGAVSYSTEETGDHVQRESTEAGRGAETCQDPAGGQNVQLDATHDKAWRVTHQDTCILTNDPNFNPGQYDIQAAQMKVVR